MKTKTATVPDTAVPMNRKKRRAGPIVTLTVTIFLAILFVFPIYFGIISAFKSNGDILRDPLAFPLKPYFQNFVDLFHTTDYFTAIWHTVFLTVVSEVLIIFVVPLAAYAIERHKTRVTKLVYAYFTAGMMIPFHLYMFPLFREMKQFHIYGTLAGPIVSYVAGSVAFGTLLYNSFLKGVPLEIEEAAKIDGCTEFQAFWRVVFPLLGPCTASMVVLNGLGIWNDFLLPYLSLPSDQAKTMTVEVYNYVGQYAARWDIVFAGSLISLVPAMIIYVCLQKYFVKGITSGAAKG